MYTQAFFILRHLLPTCALLALLCCVAPARAATTCVNSDALLHNTLSVATILANGPNTIRLVQRFSAGDHYTLPAMTMNFLQPMTIEGGYTTNCASRTINAANTIIDFGGATNDVFFSQTTGSPTALIKFEGLTLRNGGQLNLSAGDYGKISDDAGAIRMSHVRITNFNFSGAGILGPVRLDSYAAETSLEDVQFDHLTQNSTDTNCSILLYLDEDSLASFRYVTADLSNANNLCFYSGRSTGNYNIEIINSIIWSSDGSAAGIKTGNQFAQSNAISLKFVNSLYRNIVSGIASVSASGSLFTDPQWALPSNGNYHLSFNSPAVNSATIIVPGGSPETDIEGVSRIIGGTPDRGASESTFTNLPVFTVINNSDCSATNCGSLRDAITQSNTNGNISTINFAIPNTVGSGCPHVIALGTMLPPITSPIIINGYTQPGSAQNQDQDAFAATLCVLIKPVSGTLGTGFRVSSGSAGASLNLRGIGMGGFSQAVLLLDGKNHLIAGNQFGGSVAGVSLPGASLNAISIGVNAGGSLVVGGSSVADRNVIVGAGSGINVNSTVVSTPDQCQFINNLIGLGPDGISIVANDFGINLAGSGCSAIANRVAGNTIYGIWVNGSSNNVVQRNQVGIDAAGNDAENGSAIVVTGSNNAIGTTASGAVFGAYLGNTIHYIGSSGVLVSSGSGNVVRSNQIFNTGLFNGSGLDIDLGATGSTANDTNDVDSGANLLQNFPLVRGLAFTTAPVPGATFVPATIAAKFNGGPGNIRVDAYFSNGCSSAGRGGAQVYLGSVTTGILLVDNDVSFTMPATLPNVQLDAAVSLTATDYNGNTSEIGTCYPIDRIFKDGVEIPTGN